VNVPEAGQFIGAPSGVPGARATATLPVVINYFNPSQDEALRLQTQLCALRYLQSTTAVHVFVADGSGNPDAELSAFCTRHAITYVASQTRLGFAQGYNLGIAAAWQAFGGNGSGTSGATDSSIPPPAPYIVLSANDILPASTTLAALLAMAESTPRAGCIIPYLSLSDYTRQNDWVLPTARLCESMTLNLNLFAWADLDRMGGVPEDLSGYYNDIVMLAWMRERGRQVWLCPAGRVNHLHRTTVGAVDSSAQYERDTATFRARYRAWAHPGPAVTVATWNFTDSPGQKRFYRAWASVKGPRGSRFFGELERFALAWERFRIAGMARPLTEWATERRYRVQYFLLALLPKSLKEQMKAKMKRE
jgi:GT2 family glycosyltransferase